MASMRGEKVILRAFGGQPLVRVVWEVLDSSVLITDESGLKSLAAACGAMPIGFRFEDVFAFEEELARKLTENYNGGSHLHWDQLERFIN